MMKKWKYNKDMIKANLAIIVVSLTINILLSKTTEISAQNKTDSAKETIEFAAYNNSDPLEMVTDSDLDFDSAINGQNIPQNIIENLELVDVYYYGFDKMLHKGQLVVHKEVVQDIKEIFNFIKESKFPISKVIPISSYNWSDEESMKDNNTSAFNYRFISGTRVISKHAAGLAIDINPLQNPYIKNDQCIPANTKYDITIAGTITLDSQIVKEFKKRGWKWGGDWKNLKDYQHFEKKLK